MAITLNEDFNFKSVQDAFERASLYFYRLEKLANSAIEINGLKYGEFKDPLYREVCVYYQLESIRDLSKQFETVFSDVAVTLGKQADSCRQALADPEAGSSELLPEDSAQAVLSAEPNQHLEQFDIHPIPGLIEA